MISWSPRQHWNLWSHQLALHHFPGAPEPQLEVPQERPLQSSTNVLRGGALPARDDRDIEFERIKRCYSMFGLSVGISIFQWLTLSQLLTPSSQFLLAGMICMLVALSVLLLFTFLLSWNSNRYFGCLIFWTFIELIIVSVVFLMTTRSPVHILLATIAALLIFFTCYLLGALLPTSKLPGLRTACISIITIAGVGSVMLILQIATRQAIFNSIYFAVIFFSTLPLALFHAQYLHGRGFSHRLKEYLLCVLVMYMQFVIFLLPLYHFMWVQEW